MVPSLPVWRCPGCAAPATGETVRAGCSGQIPAFGGAAEGCWLSVPYQLLPPLEAERRPSGGGWQSPRPAWSPASSHRDIAAVAGGVRAWPQPRGACLRQQKASDDFQHGDAQHEGSLLQ